MKWLSWRNKLNNGFLVWKYINYFLAWILSQNKVIYSSVPKDNPVRSISKQAIFLVVISNCKIFKKLVIQVIKVVFPHSISQILKMEQNFPGIYPYK